MDQSQGVGSSTSGDGFVIASLSVRVFGASVALQSTGEGWPRIDLDSNVSPTSSRQQAMCLKDRDPVDREVRSKAHGRSRASA